MTKWIRSLTLSAVLILGWAACSMAMEPTLTWLGHAAFKFTARTGQVILIDPWITNPKAPKNITLDRVDGILITHGHADHVGEAFDLSKKYHAPIIASYELTEIAKKKGVTNVLPINPSGSQMIGDVTVTAVEAVHSSGYIDGDAILYAGAPLGFIIREMGCPTIYDAGDTGMFMSMGLIGSFYHPSVALLPIGGVYTMTPAEAAKAAQLLQVPKVVPMHFGTFPALSGTPAQLKAEIAKNPSMAVVREMTPGVKVLVKDL